MCVPFLIIYLMCRLSNCFTYSLDTLGFAKGLSIRGAPKEMGTFGSSLDFNSFCLFFTRGSGLRTVTRGPANSKRLRQTGCTRMYFERHSV